METLEKFLAYRLLDNPVESWLIALALALGVQIILWSVKRIVLSRLRRIAARTTTRVDDLAVEILSDIRPLLVFIVSLTLGAQVLDVAPAVANALRAAAVAAAAVQLIISSRLLVNFAVQSLLARSAAGNNGTPDPGLVTAIGVLRFVAMFALGAVIILLALDNMGVKVTPMLAGLGVGGIAVALAVQNILSDLFGSLSIILDKPFVVGDFITVGESRGTVEHIGIKTTRVRALSGEQLIFANSDLLKSRIQNFKRMQERRASFTFGVPYETPPAVLRAIPDVVREALLRHPGVRVDRCHLRNLGAYALEFECVYFVNSPDFNRYADVQQAVNLELIERFPALGAGFAYPTAVEIQRPG